MSYLISKLSPSTLKKHLIVIRIVLKKRAGTIYGRCFFTEDEYRKLWMTARLAKENIKVCYVPLTEDVGPQSFSASMSVRLSDFKVHKHQLGKGRKPSG